MFAFRCDDFIMRNVSKHIQGVSVFSQHFFLIVAIYTTKRIVVSDTNGLILCCCVGGLYDKLCSAVVKCALKPFASFIAASQIFIMVC